MTIDRATFLGSTGRRYLDADIEDFGVVRIQSLTESERNNVEMTGVDRRGNPDKTKLADMSIRWVIACVVDDNDNTLFTAHDMETLRGIDSAIMSKVADACLRWVSGQDCKDLEAVRGN